MSALKYRHYRIEKAHDLESKFINLLIMCFFIKGSYESKDSDEEMKAQLTRMERKLDRMTQTTHR